MQDKKITLKEAVKFHGHLGPYLVLGLLAGELALKKLKCKKYFALIVKVRGATQKPKSCLIDGLQLSTGATFGKGNIEKIESSYIKIEAYVKDNNKRIAMVLKDSVVNKLSQCTTHADAEALAKYLYKIDPLKIFELVIIS